MINEILNKLIENEIIADKTINMVPSENYASTLSRLPLILDVYNRYFFNVNNDPNLWNFRGAQEIYQLETDIAIPLLKNLSKAKFVNLRPISGLNCMQLVLNSLGKKNVMILSPTLGGHYASADLANSFGLEVKYINGVDPKAIDLNKLTRDLKESPISLIYIDQSHSLFPIDISEIVEIVKNISPNTLIHVDASHWLGLIFGGVIKNPLDAGADSFGGSTHKTFPGPQRAVFCTNNLNLVEQIYKSQYYMISSHHFGSVCSLAISLLEFLEGNGQEYALTTIENAKILANELYNYGIDVKGREYGFTEGHQVWISTNNLGINSYVASERLYKVGIRVNVFDELPGYKEPILRIGVNEITRIGAKKDEIKKLAGLMNDAIQEHDSVDIITKNIQELKNGLVNNYGFNHHLSDDLKKNYNKLMTIIINKKI